MEFLILKPSSLGDVLHAFPAVSALVRANPGAVVDWLIHPAFAELTEYLPFVRNNIFFQRRKLGILSRFPKTFRRLWQDVRAEHYDAVIDLQGLARSAAIGRCARGGIHAGPAHPREPVALCCYTRFLHAPENCHAVERNNAMIADFLGRSDLDFSLRMDSVPRFAARAESTLRAAGIEDGVPLIAVAPGARWKTKQWPPEFFADVVRRIASMRPGYRFLILGSRGEKPLAARMRAAAPEIPWADLCGETALGDLVEVIRRTSLLLCNDSGPMHIAAALEVPVLALFGPTSPHLTGPYSKKSSVLQPDLPCISCLKRYCSQMTCQKSIDPGFAADRAAAMLSPEFFR